MPVQLRRVALALAVVVHLLALYAPRVPDVGPAGVPGADKLAHVAVFALVVVAALWAGLPARWVVTVALAHAVLSELVQHLLLTDRSGDGWDVVADVVGVGLGWAVGRWLRLGERGPSGPDR